MHTPEQKTYKCVLSGKDVTTLGSKKEALEGKVNGISTDIGIISSQVILEYNALMARIRSLDFPYKPQRKKAIADINGVPSKQAHVLDFQQGRGGIPPFEKADMYHRSSQKPLKQQAEENTQKIEEETV